MATLTTQNKVTPTTQEATNTLGGIPTLIALPDGTELLYAKNHIGYETEDSDRGKGENVLATALYAKHYGHIFEHIYGSLFTPSIYGDAIHLTGGAVGYPG